MLVGGYLYQESFPDKGRFMVEVFLCRVSSYSVVSEQAQ